MLEKQRIAGIVGKFIATAAVMVLAVALSACGQTGELYIPDEAAAEDRATLPESLWPFMPGKKEDKADEPAPASPTPLELSL